MIIGGFRVSLRDPQVLEGGQFLRWSNAQAGSLVGVGAELLPLPSWLLDRVTLGRLFHRPFPCLLCGTSHAFH